MTEPKNLTASQRTELLNATKGHPDLHMALRKAFTEIEDLKKMVAALQSALETEQRINAEHARIAAEGGGFDD